MSQTTLARKLYLKSKAGKLDNSALSLPPPPFAEFGKQRLSAVSDRIKPSIKKRRVGDLRDLKEDISMSDIEEKLEEIGEEVSDHSSEIALLRQHKGDHAKEIELLTSIVIKQSKQLSHMQSKMLNMERKSMSSDILIHNVAENMNQDVDIHVKSSLAELGIKTDNIKTDNAYRKGVPRKPGSRPRPIVVTMTHQSDAKHILEVTRPKFGAPLDRKALHVTPHVPEELREKRKRLISMASAYKEKDPKANIRVKQDHLLINKEKMWPSVDPPNTQNILQMDEHNRNAADKAPVAVSSERQVKGSTFRVFTSPVNHPEQARIALLKISAIPEVAAATHRIFAYRFRNGDHGWEDDGDFGLGRFLNKLMESSQVCNRIVVLSRDFGGVHLGQHRFDVVRELYNEAMAVHDDRSLAITKDDPPSPWGSNNSINSIAPIVSSEDGSTHSTQDTEMTEASDEDVDKTLTPNMKESDSKMPSPQG